MHDRDCLHRFLFEHYPIRGHIVHLDASWRALLEHRDYPPAIRDTLGEAVAASVLLAATLKFDGTLSLQLQGQGPMHLMLAQCSSELGVRAVARYREAHVERDLAALSGEGNLTVTLENEDLSQRYQGVVPLSGERLADCLREYFESSEQLPTRLWLHATEKGASGLLLQRLSDDSVRERAKISRPIELPERDEARRFHRVSAHVVVRFGLFCHHQFRPTGLVRISNRHCAQLAHEVCREHRADVLHSDGADAVRHFYVVGG